jgi:hypothetical protein
LVFNCPTVCTGQQAAVKISTVMYWPASARLEAAAAYQVDTVSAGLRVLGFNHEQILEIDVSTGNILILFLSSCSLSAEQLACIG